jgi:hypothetical protein
VLRLLLLLLITCCCCCCCCLSRIFCSCMTMRAHTHRL